VGAVATLRGLTITPAGGRGIVASSATLYVESVTVDHAGSSGARGGAVAVDGGEVDLVDVTLSANTGAYGGHVYVTGGATLRADGLALSDGTATYGGALYARDGATIELTDVVATGPYAKYDGGFAWLEDVDLVATGLTVDSPTSHAGAGIGLYVSGYSQLDVDGGTLTRATLDTTLTSVDGGALFLGEGSSATLRDLTVSDNAAGAGAGLYVED
jgi:hypothetical protein